MPMKLFMVISTAAAIALSQAAFAQNPKTNSQTAQPPTANATQNPNPAAAQQQIQQDLKNAGFTDVKVVAESFVVQAKSKDGNPVVMTIGPHGMSAFEAMNSAGRSNSQPGTTTGQGGAPRGTKF